MANIGPIQAKRQSNECNETQYLVCGKRGGKMWSILLPVASVLLLSHH